MLKTKLFIAKQFAKKHYEGAMDAMKTFKADKAGGKMFTKIKTTGKKTPDFVKSNLKVLKKQSKKFYKKNPLLNKSDVAFIKRNPGISAAAIGVGAVAGAGIGGIASGTYNLATGQRNVRVKRKTAKQIKQMKKTYNI
jgi:hypothetical protein